MAEAPKERWIQYVALTTTILAVCAAISSLRASSYSTRVQLSTTKENSAWNYFQAKSIKQHTCETQRDLLRVLVREARDPEARSIGEESLKACLEDIARYDREKGEIKSQAEATQHLQELNKKHSAAFGLAVMLLQIAIMLSSVGALMKRPPLWVVGLGFGIAGLVYMSNGIWLWF